MSNISKKDLIDAVADATDLTKAQATEAVNALGETLFNTFLKGEGVAWAGLGSFVIRDRAAREGRNPKTGETLKIAASKSVGFKPGKALKEAMN